MPRGDDSQPSPQEPGASADTDIAPDQSGRAGPPRPAGEPPGGRVSHPGPPGATQREILAQFEVAIAGMHTREIQVGLRQLLGSPGPSSPAEAQGTAEGSRTGEVTEAEGAAGASSADVAEQAETARGRGPAGRFRAFRNSQPGVAGKRADAAGGPGSEGAAGLAVEQRSWIDLDGVPGPVAELVLAVQTPSARRQMDRLVSEAGLQRPITIDPATVARMVRPYTWLLERVGREGIQLTDAGHLPPGEVAAVIDALELGAGRAVRPGTPIRRENQAPAIVQLRESAQATGLVRKQRGRLLRTAAGDELHHDPAGLWWHLAARMPLRSAAMSEVQPGLILLACVAARFTETLDLTIARMLTAIGWIHSDGSPMTGHDATRATSGTHAVLRRLGALHDPRRGHPSWPTPEGVAFARAALRTWPTPS